MINPMIKSEPIRQLNPEGSVFSSKRAKAAIKFNGTELTNL